MTSPSSATTTSTYARIYPRPLTTIRAPQEEIGKRAAEILIRNIESSTLLPVERVVLDTEFIVRESSRVLDLRGGRGGQSC